MKVIKFELLSRNRVNIVEKEIIYFDQAIIEDGYKCVMEVNNSGCKVEECNAMLVTMQHLSTKTVKLKVVKFKTMEKAIKYQRKYPQYKFLEDFVTV